ncbi:MAG: DUF1648 domain-containing protein [Bacteroidetes bacterium]|nr:DUF1648 domain-containing protein [Bacteroidota bacterium]
MKYLSIFLIVFNFAILLGNWVYVLFYFFNLPQLIPTHYDLGGNADAFGDKKSIFVLMFVATALWMLLQYMSENPYSPGLNIPEKLRKDKNLTKLFVQGMLFFVMVLFFGISYTIVQDAIGGIEGLEFFPLIIIAVMFLYMFAFFAFVHLKK